VPQDPGLVELALGAEVAALEVQTMLPPHVAEPDDARMDELEARMAELEQDVQRRFDALQSLPAAAARPELRTAVSAWSRFRDVKAQILALSRQNTNVRSAALSLHEKRDAGLACQAALDALRQAIVAEPFAGSRPPRPR
jgi:putative heme degradation protein